MCIEYLIMSIKVQPLVMTFRQLDNIVKLQRSIFGSSTNAKTTSYSIVWHILCYTKTKWKNTSPCVTFSHHLHYTLTAIFTEAHSTIRRNLFFHFVCSVICWLMHCVCIIPVNFEPGYSGFWSQNIAKNLENNITYLNPTMFSPS